jgi:hypothetical protein
MSSPDPTDRLARPGWSRVPLRLGVVFLIFLSAGCQPRPDTDFSLQRASRHVRVLASTFGCRPAGTEANRRARDYVAGELRSAGFDVRLQEALADREPGVTTPVVNIIAVKAGRQAEAIALVSHYDSPPESRAAADDGLGVAVCLEAGRVLAARPDPRYALLVAVTDGEELGLMGARALRSAPEFARVRAFLNFEAIGTNGPARLFQSGPGNSWLAATWAGAAPFPVGSSLYTEIYRRLPNDTDFSVLKRTGTPGLDFAPTGNTVAYHTPLDTPARLASATLETLGDNAVSTVKALDNVDIRVRTADDGTFFDVAGVAAFAYSSSRTRLLSIVAFILGLLATYKAFRVTVREVGLLRMVVTALWALLAVAAAGGALCCACWALRAGRGLESPWYAQAGAFPLFLGVIGLTTVWIVVALGRALPTMVSPCGKPSCTWMITLPIWAVLTAVAERLAPGAGYLFALPLLAAAALVLALPVGRDGVGRSVCGVIAVVACALWAPLLSPLFEFLVGLFGSLPFAGPVWVFPAVSLCVVVTIGPALAGLVLGRTSRLLPGSVVASLLLLAVVALSWTMTVEPAYTSERPERRVIRYVQDNLQQKALWEVGTHERDPSPAGPSAAAPRGWQSADIAPAASLRLGPVTGPFRYRTRAPGLVAPPLEVRSAVRPAEGTGEVWLDTTAVPQLEGTGVVFALPWGLKPLESNLRGVVQNGRWRAMVLPAPASGAVLRVRLGSDGLSRLFDGRVMAVVNGVPGGIGWQRLPPWLSTEDIVWAARSYFILPWPVPESPAEGAEAPGRAPKS